MAGNQPDPRLTQEPPEASPLIISGQVGNCPPLLDPILPCLAWRLQAHRGREVSSDTGEPGGAPAPGPNHVSARMTTQLVLHGRAAAPCLGRPTAYADCPGLQPPTESMLSDYLAWQHKDKS